MSKPQILLLGTYHFDNPNLDTFNMQTDDVLSPKRQEEIQSVVKSLAKFQPTKIAIEQPIDRDDAVNVSYAEFCEESAKGIASEKRNEIVQLGFRLANTLNHEKVYAIDVRHDMQFEALMTYASTNGHEGFIAHLQNLGQSMMKEFAERQAKSTIAEMLRWFNEAESLALNHSIYLDQLRIGNAPDYIGVQVTLDWYARNLKIFNELTKIAEEDSRILLIFGQGHIPILHQTVADCTYLDLVDTLDYL